MTRETVATVRIEATKLIKRISEMQDEGNKVPDPHGFGPDTFWPSAMRGAVRRQSMELTRALAKMRRP